MIGWVCPAVPKKPEAIDDTDLHEVIWCSACQCHHLDRCAQHSDKPVPAAESKSSE